MNISLEPGRYVVAVSGGVDSVALLHLLHAEAGVELVVAHFDHGIRSDSAADRIFVSNLASKYGLKFEYTEGNLGEKASEATARAARYEFLRSVMKKHDAQAIITAHHQDDVLETAIINILRGTGRKGLNALSIRSDIHRPLLSVPKNELLAYAKLNHLQWREDSTNTDVNHLRNYVRHKIVPRLDEAGRKKLLDIIDASAETNTKLDALLVKYLQPALNRTKFQGMPHGMAKEVLAAWLRQQGLRGFDRSTLERLVVGAKTGKTGTRLDIMQGSSLHISKDSLAVSTQHHGKKS